jgi:hypothetical protein
LKDFLGAQKCTWLLRAKKNCIDNWRYDLCKLAPNNNPLLLRASDINPVHSPVLHGICAAYEDFYNAFCKIGNNYKNAQVYKNDIFRDPGSGNTLGKSFLVTIFMQRIGTKFVTLHLIIVTVQLDLKL